MNLLERESNVFFHTYKRIPLEIERGDGVYLFGKDGKKYLDMFAGLAVNALGYNHPRVIEAMERQIKRYVHLSNYYLQDPQIELSERLVKATGFRKVFLTNSGTEAIEGALKIARKWGKNLSHHADASSRPSTPLRTGLSMTSRRENSRSRKEGRDKSVVVSFTNAFHGRTMGALSSMDRAKYRDGYEPFLPGFVCIPFNDVHALRSTINDETLAVMLEFIQGEGGINVAKSDFASELQRLKQEYDFLIIADEIQTGVGRTGKFLAFQHYAGVEPDIVAIAKPLGGGLPLGAILGSERVGDVLHYGVHGTTFGGNPVACAAGTVVLDELFEKDLMQHVTHLGNAFLESLKQLQREFPSLIANVRGKGFIIGVELTREGDSTVEKMREEGVLINCTNQTVLRFLPPFIITQSHVEETVSALRKVLREVGG